MSGKFWSVVCGVMLVALSGCMNSKADTGSDSMQGMTMSSDQSKSAASSMPMAMKYTCSMHPEVVSDSPGTCPKCGMTLVAKK